MCFMIHHGLQQIVIKLFNGWKVTGNSVKTKAKCNHSKTSFAAKLQQLKLYTRCGVQVTVLIWILYFYSHPPATVVYEEQSATSPPQRSTVLSTAYGEKKKIQMIWLEPCILNSASTCKRNLQMENRVPNQKIIRHLSCESAIWALRMGVVKRDGALAYYCALWTWQCCVRILYTMIVMTKYEDVCLLSCNTQSQCVPF